MNKKLKRCCCEVAGLYNMLAYVVQIAVVIKTQLGVQDNRLCNVVTLCGCCHSDEDTLPRQGKVWLHNLDEAISLRLELSLQLDITLTSDSEVNRSL